VSTTDPNDLRDPRLDAAWRAASHEEPPGALDDAIRAAARREVGAGPQTMDARASSVPSALRPESWWAPLAAAATIGAIAIGLLQLSTQEHAGAPVHDKSVVSDVPSVSAPVVAAPSEASSAGREVGVREAIAPQPAVPVVPSVPARLLRKDASGSTAADDRPAANGSASAPTSAPPPAMQMQDTTAVGAMSADAGKFAPPAGEPFPLDAAKRESTEALANATAQAAARGESRREAPRAPAPVAQFAEPASPTPKAKTAQSLRAEAAGAASAPTTSASPGAPPTLAVPDWVALIRKLRDEGRTDEAAKELAAFRAAHPDHERLLPPDLRDWKPAPR
jgi:hypothetical protein